MDNFQLVFVCTGNICRSPLAEGIMKDCILDEIESGGEPLPIKVSSAGTSAVDGFPASEYSVEAAARHGIDISAHRSTQLSDGIVNAADLILTMEPGHTAIIKQYWPGFENVYELKSYNSTTPLKILEMTVIDPIGMSLEIYLNVFDEIKQALDRISQSIFADARDNFAG
jgi:protein-tyrosine-phosphatase